MRTPVDPSERMSQEHLLSPLEVRARKTRVREMQVRRVQEEPQDFSRARKRVRRFFDELYLTRSCTNQGIRVVGNPTIELVSSADCGTESTRGQERVLSDVFNKSCFARFVKSVDGTFRTSQTTAG